MHAHNTIDLPWKDIALKLLFVWQLATSIVNTGQLDGHQHHGAMGLPDCHNFNLNTCAP